MQVHEISRQALEELKRSGRLEDWGNGFGDYVIVGCPAAYKFTPTHFDLVDSFESEYWACHQADIRQEFSLSVTADCHYDYTSCPYYEVWHIVDDEPTKKVEHDNQIVDRVIIYPGNMAGSLCVYRFETGHDACVFYDFCVSNSYVKGTSYAIEREKLRSGRWIVVESSRWDLEESLRQLREAAVM